jgi:hypothetical protein
VPLAEPLRAISPRAGSSFVSGRELSVRGLRRGRTRTQDRLGQQDPEYAEAS